MAQSNEKMTKKAVLIATLMILILFIGLFVGYGWGADAARRDNAAEAAATSPI